MAWKKTEATVFVRDLVDGMMANPLDREERVKVAERFEYRHISYMPGEYRFVTYKNEDGDRKLKIERVR